MKKIEFFVFFASLLLLLGACAKKTETPNYMDDTSYQEYEDKLDSGEGTISDPLEPGNRIVYIFNDMVYVFLFDPAKDFYKALLPEIVQTGIGNFFRNLSSIFRFAGNVMQWNSDVGIIVGEFVVNSSPFGLFGLIDQIDYQYSDDEDIGQGLASWGVGEGFFLVVPLFGCSNARDAAADAISSLADPVNKLGNIEKIASKSLRGMDQWSRYSGVYSEIKKGSGTKDHYIAYRNACVTYRIKQIHGEGKTVVSVK